MQFTITLYEIVKGRTECQKPIHPCKSIETVKGRTETQYPMWAINLWREEQKPETHVTLKKKEKKRKKKPTDQNISKLFYAIYKKGKNKNTKLICPSNKKKKKKPTDWYAIYKKGKKGREELSQDPI